MKAVVYQEASGIDLHVMVLDLKKITWPQVLDLGPLLKLKGKYIDLNYTFRLTISKRFKLWV